MLAYLTAALQLAPILIQAGQDIGPLAAKIYAMFQAGTDPTDADWAELHALEAQQTAAINAAIPGEDGGA